MTVQSIETTKDLVILGAREVARVRWEPFRGMPNVAIRELWRTDQGVAGLLRFEAGAHEVPHEHHVGHHHLWLIEGAARMGTRVLRPGSYIHVPARVRHEVAAEGPDGCTFFFVYSRSNITTRGAEDVG